MTKKSARNDIFGLVMLNGAQASTQWIPRSRSE